MEQTTYLRIDQKWTIRFAIHAAKPQPQLPLVGHVAPIYEASCSTVGVAGGMG